MRMWGITASLVTLQLEPLNGHDCDQHAALAAPMSKGKPYGKLLHLSSPSRSHDLCPSPAVLLDTTEVGHCRGVNSFSPPLPARIASQKDRCTPLFCDHLLIVITVTRPRANGMSKCVHQLIPLFILASLPPTFFPVLSIFETRSSSNSF